MSDGMTREDFLRERRRLGPERMDRLFAPHYDRHWGEVGESHRQGVAWLLQRTPEAALVLDAGCGTGKYWPQIIAAGRHPFGIDRSSGMLAQAARKHPDVEARLLPMEDLWRDRAFQDRFDGAICMDAMENVPPEDWSAVLRGLVGAVHVGGPILLTVEVPQEEDRSALANPPPPLVQGEILFPNGGYHHYPGLDCVTEWVEAAGLEVLSVAEGDGYTHLRGRRREPATTTR